MPKMQYLIRQAGYPQVGMLPLVRWGDPPKKPVLSARNSMMFGHRSTTRIPPMKGKFSLPRSPPEQVVKARKPVPCSHILLPRPKKSEVKVQEEPRKGAAKEEEAHMKTKRQDDWHREPHSKGYMPLTSRPLETNGVATFPKCSPEPLDFLPRHPEGNLSENTQTSLRNFSPERHVTGSDSPVGDVLPPSKPDPDAAVFSAPTTCCSLLPKRPTKGLGEDHRPNSPGSPTSGKEMQREKPSDMPSRSTSSAVSASSRRCKRKIPLPLLLPLPLPLPPPLQLQWGRGELPPPPKLPCLALDKNLGPLEKNTECQWNKSFENTRKVMEDCSAPQPAPSFSLPASQVATFTLKVPATTTHLADISSRAPIQSVPPPSPTSRHTVPSSTPLATPADSLPPSGPSHSVVATSSLTSNLPTCPSTSTFFQPSSYKNESPTPMCIDSPPPLFLPTSLPVPSTIPTTSVAVPSTITALASTGLTSQPTSDPGVTDMDTTPPSYAVIFRVEQRHPEGVPVSTSPPVQMVPHPNSQPTLRTSDGQQRASLPRAPVVTSLPLSASGAIYAPTGSTSANVMPAFDINAMDTTPPSQAVIFHSPPISRDNHYPFHMTVPGSDNTPPSGSNAVAYASPGLPAKSVKRQATHSKPLSDSVISSQITVSACNRQVSKTTGNPVAPAQNKGLTYPAGWPARGSRMQPSLLGSPSATTVNTAPASGGNLNILPSGASTTAGFGVATKMPSTSSSPSANTTPGQPMFKGPTTPMDSGSSGVNMSALHPTNSGVSQPLNFRAGLSRALHHFCSSSGQIVWGPSSHTMAAVVGGPSTIPVFGHIPDSTLSPNTWGIPVANTNGTVMAGNNTIPMTGSPSVSTFHNGTWDPPGHREWSTLKRSIIPKKECVSRDRSISTFHQNHTTSVGTASACTTPGVRHTSSSTRFPNTWGQPVQSSSWGTRRDDIIPMAGGPGITAFHQYSWGPPGQYPGSAAGGNNIAPAPLMAGPSINTSHQTWNPSMQSTGNAVRNSTIPAVTGYTYGPLFIQSNWGTPGQNPGGAMGVSTTHT
nr:nuclear pore-associated protein 1-like [Vicugna pacos]